jgi:uncharacterized membrane protein YoaK (UPF0700 family)
VTPIGLDRTRRGEDVWLGQKLLFFVVGAALGVAGMITGRQWIIWVAIAVLALGLVLRLAGRRGPATRAREDVKHDDDEEAGAERPPDGI